MNEELIMMQRVIPLVTLKLLAVLAPLVSIGHVLNGSKGMRGMCPSISF